MTAAGRIACDTAAVDTATDDSEVENAIQRHPLGLRRFVWEILFSFVPKSNTKAIKMELSRHIEPGYRVGARLANSRIAESPVRSLIFSYATSDDGKQFKEWPGAEESNSDVDTPVQKSA